MNVDNSMNRPVANRRLKSLGILVFVVILGLIIGIFLWGQYITAQQSQLDETLQQVIEQHNLRPIDLGPSQDPKKVALGQALFFDKELSGNRDVACATCHHPGFSSGDELPLSIGVGGEGLGAERKLGDARLLVPRNAPDIFNRGSTEWRTMFWDGRVEILDNDEFDSPADEELPEGLDNVVAIQAMFPVTSNVEMRGKKGDIDIHGNFNEIAAMNPDDFTEIWIVIMDRLLAIPEYAEWFAEVYPDVPQEVLGFEHAANAIAAFEIAAFSFDDSPWDRYLAGDETEMSDEAKAGAILFYGKGGCSTCHSGNLMTDQDYHNMLVPQIGPGKFDNAGYDLGRADVSRDEADAFAFRTPPLRNVTISGPWMHNGSYYSLEAVIRHHMDPLGSLQNYSADHLTPELAETYRNDLSTVLIMSETVDPYIDQLPDLSDTEIKQL